MAGRLDYMDVGGEPQNTNFKITDETKSAKEKLLYKASTNPAMSRYTIKHSYFILSRSIHLWLPTHCCTPYFKL